MTAKPDNSDAARMMCLFAGFEGAHGTHGAPTRDGMKWEIKTTAATHRTPVTLDLWRQHLDGRRPLGVIPIRADNTCSWGSIDIDLYDVNLLEIVARVAESEFPLVPGRSKSGGLHLFLFLQKPEPASAVQGALREMAASLGFAGCEIFPKQTTVLSDKGGLGNWMVMPYFGGTFGGKLREQVGLRRTGAEMTLGEFIAVAEKAAVTEASLASVTAPSSAKKKVSKKVNGGAGGGPSVPFADGPPCLQHMARGGFPEGGRNKALFHVGIYLKRADPSNWEQRLEQANQSHMRPPLSTDEVTGVLRSLKKKDYEYLCKEEPMCSHCDAILCRTRKFGVGGGGAVPLITGLSKLLIVPPIWFVYVEGDCVECSTEELQNYQRFHKLCMEKLDRCYRSMKQDSWYGLVSVAMANVDPIPAPPDAGTPGRFQELLEDFCTDRARGERREDLLSGRPWEDEENGRHYFRLRDIDSFVRREGVRDMSRGQMTMHVRKLGGDHKQVNVKGKNINAWWIPSSALAVNPPVDPPTKKEDEI